jgi:hypothetical protein
MKSIYGEVRVAVGQNDDDPAPEARVQVVVGNVVVFEYIADVSDVAKLVDFATGLLAGFARVAK